MNPHSDMKIVDSWGKNASQWTAAVREGQIESRKLVTDKAIVDAVMSHSPESVVDIGCGEGWLVRELASRGVRAVGVDAIPALIDHAKAAGGGDFLVMPYEAISHELVEAQFDVAVCNFSLLGKEVVESLFVAVPSLLKPGGVFIVQTLHPVVMNGNSPYVDGWRGGSWAGFSEEFVDPAPWYFRTVESWRTLFFDSGFALREIHEPVNPKTGKPASIIFVGESEI
ncbi:MAG: methyltransferase type 12 [Gammaproteobacteria bacterium RIFCSPLOWO2_02_FULL_57_10]|nr:MAG: methyltransferase type 12 [Gammaproteobacteria bacterium RIFCSPLOWO2_02_FULL_57_10]